MNGVVAVDKPAGMTSAQVVAVVKKTLRAKKVGHAGTLDPFATGVLVCCINQATRLTRFLTQSKKVYEAVMRLGVQTDTQDLTGRVVREAPVDAVSDERIKEVFDHIRHIDSQVPPAFSALKYKGKPLYKLARQGISVTKAPRRIRIERLQVLDIDLPFVRFKVVCGPGTYIRTLSADLGEALGCGGHLVALRRTESSGFTLSDAVSLEALGELATLGKAQDCVLSMNDALREMQEVQVPSTLAEKIPRGVPVNESVLGPVQVGTGAWVKVTDSSNNLLAVLDAGQRGDVLPYLCVFPSACACKNGETDKDNVMRMS